MFYDEVKVKEISSAEEYTQAWEVMAEEFPDHRDTNLLDFYEHILIAKKSKEVIGLITSNKYLPKKALLCDIVVTTKYRSKGVGIKLLKELGILLRGKGHTHVIGFTSKTNKEALSTYKRIHTHQEEMILTVCDINLSEPCVLQIESVIRARESRHIKNAV